MITSPLSEHTVATAAGDIFYAEAGTGIPVVLLHGGGPGASGVSNFARNIDALAAHFRVIVPDLPGYGRSTKGVDHTDPFGHLAAGIRGLLDELALEQADLVGNSYGGACAIRLALDTPERVRRMVLMGPGGIGTTRNLPTAGLNSLLSYYRGTGPSRPKLERFIRDHLVFDGSAVPAELIDLRFRASIDPEVVADPPLRRPTGPLALQTLWRMDLTRDPRLARLETPTLVIWGQADEVNRPSGGRRLTATMPRCDLLTVCEAGHWVQWERAELFNTVTCAFLEEER